MSIKIRLSRAGRKGEPFYKIVVADARSPRDGKFIEKIGHYNSLAADDHAEKLVVKQERAEYWLSVGAQPSTRAAILLAKFGVKGADKYQPKFTPRKKGEGAKKKAQEAAAKAAEAAAKAAEEAKAAAEAPVENNAA